MSPSQICRDAGLKSLTKLSELTEQSSQTLINWFKNKPQLFRVVLAGAVIIPFQDRTSSFITSPSQACREAGLNSLTELAELSDQSSQTLINWFKNKPHLFCIVLAGAVVIRFQERVCVWRTQSR